MILGFRKSLQFEYFADLGKEKLKQKRYLSGQQSLTYRRYRYIASFISLGSKTITQ